MDHLVGTIIEKVRVAGVVGAGGAGFPTHQKLRRSVHTVVANGAECEPVLGTDRAIMRREAARVVSGLAAAVVATGAERGIIALKAHYHREVAALRTAIAGRSRLSLHLLGDAYPAGDEQTLTYEVTGLVTPEGGLPLDVGVLIQNVGTLMHVAEALEDRPVTHRHVTVAGEVRSPKVVRVPLGTPLRDLVEAAGGTRLREYRLLEGGPMMGQLATGETGVSKTTGGVLVLPADHIIVRRRETSRAAYLQRAKSACDGCRLCTDRCPRYLLGHRIEPHLVMRAAAYERDDMADYLTAAFLCCQCGVCDVYSCPTGISPRAIYQGLRQEFGRVGLKNPLREQPQQAREAIVHRKIPVEQVARRAGVADYLQEFDFDPTPLKPALLRLKLRQHVGVPAVARVRPGEQVAAGDLIAEIPEGKLGAPLHAPLAGQVLSVDAEAIRLQPL